MKVKIKYFNGELPSYLSENTVYEVVTPMNYLGIAQIYNDDGCLCDVQLLSESRRLNGGSWEIVE